MKIMIINPNSSQDMTDADADAGRSVAREGTEVVAVTPDYAPASIESFYDEYLCVPESSMRSARATAKASMPTSSPATATPACTPRAR